MRRLLIVFLCTALVCPALYCAERVIVSIVKTNENEYYDKALAGFKAYLNENDLAIWCSEHNMEGKEDKAKEICDKVKSEAPDIILTIGTLATKSICSRETAIPVVACMILDHKLVDDRPNASAVMMNVPLDTKCEMLGKIYPGIKGIGVIYSPDTEEGMKEVMAHQEKTNCSIIARKISSVKELSNAFKGISGQVEALLMVPDPKIYTIQSTKYIIMQCIQGKIALIGLSSSYTKAGALFSLDSDYEDMGRQAGEITLKISRGEPRENIKYSYPRKARLSVNLITSQRIKRGIPEEVLEQAVEVFGQ